MGKPKNIIIFGASQGIGYAVAKEFYKRGNNLVLLSRNTNNLSLLNDELTKDGDSRIFIKYCDTTKRELVKEGIEFALSSLGSLDIMLYNSGMGFPEPFINFNSDNIIDVFNTNLYGLAYSMEYIIPVFKKQGYGIIAGVSSLADARGFPGSASYCTSKAAASTFLESARVELQQHNIKVITIKPGFVRTAMTDKNNFKMPFLMDTDKAAKIIVNGIEKKKKIIQFPLGTVLLIKLVNILPNFIYDSLIVKSKGG